jgi:hypothetical protein
MMMCTAGDRLLLLHQKKVETVAATRAKTEGLGHFASQPQQSPADVFGHRHNSLSFTAQPPL